MAAYDPANAFQPYSAPSYPSPYSTSTVSSDSTFRDPSSSHPPPSIAAARNYPRVRTARRKASTSRDSNNSMTDVDGGSGIAADAVAITANKPKRVRTGCLTCRERHLKCDEGLPNCQNCRKSSRICKRGVRLNFIDTQVQSPPIIQTSADWAGNYIFMLQPSPHDSTI